MGFEKNAFFSGSLLILNWVHKMFWYRVCSQMNNLKKILQMVVDYYNEVSCPGEPKSLWQTVFISISLNTLKICCSSFLLVIVKPSVWTAWAFKISAVSHCSLTSLPLCHQVLGQEISDFPLPDLALAAEQSDPVELGRLLQLILGCAVKCERKQGVWLLLCCTHILDTNQRGTAVVYMLYRGDRNGPIIQLG